MADSISIKWTGRKDAQIGTRIGLHDLVFAPVCPLYKVNDKDFTKFNVHLEKVAGNYQDY